MKTHPFPIALVAVVAALSVPAIAVRAQDTTATAPAAATPASPTPTTTATTSAEVAITPAPAAPATAATTSTTTASTAVTSVPAATTASTPSITVPLAATPAPSATASTEATSTSSTSASGGAAADTAATASATTTATSTTTADGATKTAATKGKNAAGEGTLSVDFPDEDIRNILRNVADLFELNIIMPETLQGKTTIKLRDVTWRQIFENVLDPVGYTYVEDGNIIKIVSKESLNQEPVTTEVFVINYARAADILPTVNSLVDPAKGGKIVVDTRSNSLVITERPTRLSRIRPIIEELDHATDQVMIESKFVEVSDTDVKNIGVNWASLNGYTLTAGNLGSTFDRSRGQTSSNGFSGNNGTQGQNMTGTTTSNTTNTNSGNTNTSTNSNTVTGLNGVNTNQSSTGTTGSINSGTTVAGVNGTSGSSSTTLSNAMNFLNSVTNTGSISREVTAMFSADDFKLVLSALQTQTDVKIVSNPTIVTLNNNEATINVGESDPIPNYAFNQQTGSFEVNGFNYKDIGVILKVTPQVNARGFIKLTLSPEVSQKNGFAQFGVAQIPIIATRKAVTQVSLRDGYTMGIGGLLSTQTTKGQSKVPVLGSIPVLGRLFRSDNHNTVTTNLIIFITAKTVSADGAPVEQVFDSRRVRQLEMRRDEMPGYRDGSSPFVDEMPPPPKKR